MECRGLDSQQEALGGLCIARFFLLSPHKLGMTMGQGIWAKVFCREGAPTHHERDG